MLENANSLHLAGILLTLCMPIFGIIGSLIVYIFRRHTKDNERQLNENREDHIRIWEKLDNKKDKK